MVWLILNKIKKWFFFGTIKWIFILSMWWCEALVENGTSLSHHLVVGEASPKANKIPLFKNWAKW